MAPIRQAIRIAAAVCLLMALALVGAGTGVCGPVLNSGFTRCTPFESYPIGIWNQINQYYTIWSQRPTLSGQYYIFFVSLLLLVATIVVIVTIFLGLLRNKTTVFVFALAGAILCIINFGVEAYYAWGWLSWNRYVQSWVAATAFYIICAVLYGLDAFLTKRSGI